MERMEIKRTKRTGNRQKGNGKKFLTKYKIAWSYQKPYKYTF